MELFGIIFLSALALVGTLFTLQYVARLLYAPELERTALLVPVTRDNAREILSLMSSADGSVVAVCDSEALVGELAESGLCDVAIDRNTLNGDILRMIYGDAADEKDRQKN